MRHRTRTKTLSRNISERKALLKSLATHLITYQRIKTSLVKAKEARKLVEKLITLGKDGTVNARRQAYKILNDRDKVKLLFTEIAPLFKKRTGGYTRIIRMYPRRGDGAEMVLLELTEKPVKELKKPKEKKVEEKKKIKQEQKKIEPKEEVKPVKEELEKKVAPPPAHEKKAKEPRKEEKPTKKPTKAGFFKDLRQYFKRKSIE